MLRYWFLFWWFLFLLLTACAEVPSPTTRTDSAAVLATRSGWQQIDIATDDFDLRAYGPQMEGKVSMLTIYIEGDGLAWISSSTPSQDPTPMNPLALKLALKDDAPAVYLARPCQYVGAASRNCSMKYWTGSRFAEEVVRASNQALDWIKQRYGADRLILVGYSGGGAVAALTAARRKDVAYLVTVAGNPDHRLWAREHHVSPLAGSLNPADQWRELADIPQTHFVGGKDEVINASIARAYAASFTGDKPPAVIELPEFDHACCWESAWPTLRHGLPKIAPTS